MIEFILGLVAFIIILVICLFGGEESLRPAITGGVADDAMVGGSMQLLPYQKKIGKKFRKYKSKKLNFREFCFPPTYKLQNQQRFLGDYMAPGGGGPKELLVYHKIGGGKTCVMIQIAERWLRRGKPLALMPASLVPGFYAELRSPCAGERYISSEDRARLKQLAADSKEAKQIITESDERIDEFYDIMSYNAFYERPPRKEPPVILIDEVQNVCNESGNIYRKLKEYIASHPSMMVIILTGTPIFDSLNGLYGLFGLMRTEIDRQEELKPAIIKRLDGRVSYFPGAPNFTYPKTEIIIKQLPMSNLQKRCYLEQVELEKSKSGKDIERSTNNDFYIKSRQKSLISYPKCMNGRDGIHLLTPHMIVSGSLATYSCKLDYVARKIRKKRELTFIQCEFKNEFGVAAITKVLDALGYSDYFAAGPGPKRYAVWSGDESREQKRVIRDVYNAADNDDASKIEIVIGTTAIKAGVSLLRTKRGFVLSTYFSHSQFAQIYGRINRFCSHKTLPLSDRYVKIYLLLAVTARISEKKKSEVTVDQSIDMLMLNIADKKARENDPFLEEMVDRAIDKALFQK